MNQFFKKLIFKKKKIINIMYSDPKIRLLPQITNHKWSYGVKTYDNNATENGLIISEKYIDVDKNYNRIFNLFNETNTQQTTQHKLLKINNDFFEVISYFYTGQETPKIELISEDEYNIMNETFIIIDDNIQKTFKIRCSNISDTQQYYFKIVIKYKKGEKNQKCYINYHEI